MIVYKYGIVDRICYGIYLHYTFDEYTMKIIMTIFSIPHIKVIDG